MEVSEEPAVCHEPHVPLGPALAGGSNTLSAGDASLLIFHSSLPLLQAVFNTA